MSGKPTYEELEKRARDLENRIAELSREGIALEDPPDVFRILYDLAIAMTAELGVDKNLQLVAEKSRELFGTDTAFVALCDEEQGDVFMHSFSGIKTEEFKRVRLPLGEGIGGLVAKTGRGYIVEDYFTDNELTGKLDKIVALEGLISVMAAPIQMRDENLGVLYVANRARTLFLQSDLDTLFLIANLAATEIARNQVKEALLKTQDELEQRVKERTAELSESNVLLRQEMAERKQTVEALRESERHIRTLLHFAPYPIVVFTLDGLVSYLNPAFTEVFGWDLIELEGKRIPYVPPELVEETSESLKKLFEEKAILRHETRRLTKDGRVLDVIMRGALYLDSKNEPAGEFVIVRDITQEKRIAKNNEAMLRISMALPEYPDLEELLDYIYSEVIQLLNTEGCFGTLLDEERHELFFLGAAYEDAATQKRVKGMRFSMDLMDQFVVRKGIKTGEPIIVNDTSKILRSYPVRDEKLGYPTKNFLQVTLRSSERIIGTLCAINKKEGLFEQTDVDLLNMVAGTVVLSIENARYSKELKESYREVLSLNRAKDKVFHHLSHELKTPISVLSGSLSILERKLAALTEKNWIPTMARARRNLDRILGIEYEVEDIIHDRQYRSYELLSLMVDQCADVLEMLVADEVGEGPVVERINKRIEEEFGRKEMVPQEIVLAEYVKERIEYLEPLFSHRQVEIIECFEPTGLIYMPLDPLEKVVHGLIRNAVENTPDEGKIEVSVKKNGEGAELVVRDYGVGITEENQGAIFEGFFATQETLDYSSKNPFDFNAGGKGADLLRTKIFSERYNFSIGMVSSRCRFIPKGSDACPGRIAKCTFCEKPEDCHASGGTVFTLFFLPGHTAVSQKS